MSANSRVPKVLLLNDTTHWYHWGCTGTSLIIKEKIQEIGYELTAVSIVETYRIKKVPNFEDFDSDEAFKHFCQANSSLIEKLHKTDALLINGEGSIHDFRRGAKHLLYTAYVAKTKMRKHTEIINHSPYPRDDSYFLGSFAKRHLPNWQTPENIEEIYRCVYKSLDFTAIREKMSMKKMAELDSLPKESALSFDCLPIYIKKHYKKPKQIKKNTRVFAGSVSFTDESIPISCRYLKDMVSRGYVVKVLTGASEHPAPDDREFVELFQKQCQKEQLDTEILHASSLDQWLETIQSAEILVSGRFHHTIAAYCLNTPFVVLNSNTTKIHAICEDFNVSEPLHYKDPALYEKLHERTKEALLQREDKAKEKKLLQLEERAMQNFEGLNKCFTVGS